MSTARRRASTLALTATIAAIASSQLACGRFEPPDAEPAVLVDYPVEHYLVSDQPGHLAAWKREVRALRTSLRETYPFDESRPELKGESKEVAFLDKAVDPAAILWRDPAAAWREPLILSWWELIDETGAIRKVVVITSNHPRESDARVIAWCLEGKTWKPAIVDGRPVASIRSASINLGESKFHVAYWQKKISIETAAVLVVLGIAVGVRGAWALVPARPSRRESGPAG